MSVDHYRITEKTIREPPTGFVDKLRLLGPGFILSASIVGSGELIATTILGASAGFTAFWVIIVSCLMKVAVQLEFGKHTILTGETAMLAFNKLPGWKMGKARWSVWVFFLLILLKIIQLGGMTGTTAIVLNMLFPGISIFTWVWITVLITSLFIFQGYYAMVEKFSLFMIAMFTLLTITAVFALRFTPFSFSWNDIASGLTFDLSPGIVGIAIGAFGITGVASDEIIAYNYWCLEKGYAAFAGPPDGTDEWKRRARGWIRIMYLDATVAMVIYTLVTAAFYILGASILHDRAAIPLGTDLIETVALIYTETLGSGIRNVYLMGAFFALYSSLFVSLAAWTRVYSDIFGQIGLIDFFNLEQRKKIIAIVAWGFPVTWAMAYFFVQLPLLMILSGGVVGSVMLFLVIFATLDFRYRRKQFFKSGVVYDTALWISIISIFGVGVYGLVKLFY